MTGPHGMGNPEDRIRRIENNQRLEPFVSVLDVERTTLTERMAYYATPGVSVAVINNGELEWSHGYGVLEAGSDEPVTPESIFQACSISKHVAMVGVLRLVQDGVLDLDDDINDHLVSWKLPANGPWQPRITLRQVLGHTAGLTQNWYRGFRHGASTPTLLQVLEGQPPSNTPPVRSVLLPGSEFRYSGSHYSVVQQLMIDVTHEPFPQLMRELVFEPLDMRNSSYDQEYPDKRPGSTAIGHYLGGEPVHGKWRVIPEMAGAGLWTTPSDLARLALEIQRAHQQLPTRFLRKEVVDQALAPQTTESFALGTQLEGKGDSLRFGHGGSNIGYKCLSIAYAEHGMGAVVMTNGDDGYEVLSELVKSVAQEYDWPDYLPSRNVATADTHTDDRYAGEYELRPSFSLIVRRQGDDLLLEAPGEPPITFRPSSDHTFFAEVIDAEISFVGAEDGQVTALALRQEERELSATKRS